MKKNILISGLICLLFIPLISVAQKKIKIIDAETNDPVSFAVVTTNSKNIIFAADVDGFISATFNLSTKYEFSRIGYKSRQLSGAELAGLDIVKMEMIAYDINPIIVTADAAWKDLERAIERTSATIPKTPFYLKCLQKDKVEKSNIVVVNASAIFATKVFKTFKSGKGCLFSTKLKELKVNFYNNYTSDSIKYFSYYQIPSYVNEFLVGDSKYDKDVSFYYVDVNDSIVIIGYSPKLDFTPTGRVIITSGRFLIDKRNWKILRIDSDLNLKMLEYQNKIANSDTKKEKLIRTFSRTIYFSEKGFPEKLEERYEFIFNNDKNKNLWINTLVHNYEEILKNDYEVMPNKKAEQKSIIFQKPTLN